MKAHKHECKYKEINMPIKHKTHQILFLPFAKQNINTFPPLWIKQGKHAYILNTSQILLPLLSIINKGVKVKTKCSPPFYQKQKLIKG